MSDFSNQTKALWFGRGVLVLPSTPFPPTMGMHDMIVVNDFMFCTDHGSEYCPSCTCDHRLSNNFSIEFDEETTERLEEAFNSLDVRVILS